MLRCRLLAAAAMLVLSLTLAPTALAAPSGQLYAFGYNYYGQLGSATNSGTSTPNPTPVLVSLPGQNSPVTQVAADGYHSLAATASGQLYGFGENYYGQLGSATNSGTESPSPTPVLVSLPGQNGPVTQVVAGAYHSLAATASGQLYGFGYNGYGQLGSSTNSGTLNPNPTPVLVSLPGQNGPVVQGAAGYAHSLALTASGQLYAFGYNEDGELGSATNNGTSNPNPTPVLVSLPGQNGPVTQVAAGYAHSLALTASGQLYAFGYNYYGQLGSATNSGTENPNPTPVLVSLPGQNSPVIQIAAGAYHSLALTASGQLYAFGYNRRGQLGSATNSGTENPNPTPVLVSLPGQNSPVVQIAAGYAYSLAATASGQLYAFGENYFGELGSATNNGTSNPNPTPVLASLTIPAGMTIGDIATGSYAEHTLVALVTPPEEAPPTPSSPATTPSRSPARGPHQALVKNGKARVRLRCPGPASCAGRLVLKAKLKATAKRKNHSGRARPKAKRPKLVKIGSAAFSIRPGKRRTIAVPLNSKALRQIRAAGQSGLQARLGGKGVKPGNLLLKAAPRKHKRR